jgi:hypothetical protein
MTTPLQILVVRHAEKPPEPASPTEAPDPNLSLRGHQRAAALGVFVPGTFAKIDFLFASRDSDNSDRPLQTITPLGQAIGLSIDTKYKDKDFAELAAHLGDPKFAGTRVLVAWHHGKIPELAAALGVNNPPAPWNPAMFDRIWQIDYDAAGKAALTDVPQKLLYGDSAT